MLLTAFLLLPYLLWTLFYGLKMKKGYVQGVVLAVLLLGFASAAWFLSFPLIFYLGFLGTLALYVLFYANELRLTGRPLRVWQYLVICYLLYIPLTFLPLKLAILLAPLAYLFLLLDLAELGKPLVYLGILVLYGLFYLIPEVRLTGSLALIAFFLIYFLSLDTRDSFSKTAEKQVSDALMDYADEVQATHLQMRSWRHDFHNHLQSMKFLLQQGREAELGDYLNELDRDLLSVDTMVKSGQMSVDAILNSKLSLAKAANIDLDVTVFPLPELGISDIDLTALLGNLMDNAIEACEKIPEDERFIRLYLDCMGEQLYLSLQNSAKEDLSFNDRNYISSKRGRHGLGMKRVALVVDKYGGTLNLQNEPGVFAVEVTFALPREEDRSRS